MKDATEKATTAVAQAPAQVGMAISQAVFDYTIAGDLLRAAYDGGPVQAAGVVVLAVIPGPKGKPGVANRVPSLGAKPAPGRGPNPGGSRGGAAHRGKVEQRVGELKGQGHKHIGGGSKKEEVIKTPGGQKSSRRPDVTTESPDGSIHRENVGRTTKSGEPVKRERDALDDIETATGERPTFTPYTPQ